MASATTTSRTVVRSSFNRNTTADEICAGLDLKGLTVIVTGGATGIGIETCSALGKAGAAEIVLAVRKKDLAERAVAEVQAKSAKDTKVSWAMLDLSDLSSVRAFAANWGDAKPVNVLINNAGVMACPLEYTRDGFEMQIGTNHFGHFLLTLLLVPALKAGAERLGRPSRVVCLSSIGHRRSPIVFEDIHFKTRPYDKWQAYGQSKTANALFALELDKRYKDSGIRAFSVHPGGIMTPLQRHMAKEEMVAMGWIDEHGQPRAVGFKTPEQGASTSVWAAVSPELEGVGGFYLEDCSQALPFDKNVSAFTGVLPHATSEKDAEKLWVVSMEAVGLPDHRL